MGAYGGPFKAGCWVLVIFSAFQPSTAPERLESGPTGPEMELVLANVNAEVSLCVGPRGRCVPGDMLETHISRAFWANHVYPSPKCHAKRVLPGPALPGLPPPSPQEVYEPFSTGAWCLLLIEAPRANNVRGGGGGGRGVPLYTGYLGPSMSRGVWPISVPF